MDWSDVLASTVTHKLGIVSKAGVGVFNSFVDFTYENKFKVAGMGKENSAVGLDLMFNGLKSWVGGAATLSSASENTQNGIEVMLDQAKKTITDAAGQ